MLSLGALLGAGLAATPTTAMSFLPRVALTPDLRPAPVASVRGLRVDAVLVKKSQRRLYLLREGRVLRTYRVRLGISPVGPKTRQGDNKTPEGTYRITWRNDRSRFRKALHLSYPNAADRAHAAQLGVDPGGLIAIHGQPRGGANAALRALIQDEDWTEGCIAVSNPAIDELWALIPNGTPIEIRP